MTDRIRTLTVTLDRDYRDDDAQAVIDALRMIRGVSSVEMGVPVDGNQHYAASAFRTGVFVRLSRLLSACTSLNPDDVEACNKIDAALDAIRD